MKWNPIVQFIIVNIVEDGSKQADKIVNLKKVMNVENLHIEVVSITRFNVIVNTKLGINATVDSSWYYKMCDYKPTLAFLFPELVPESKYKVK